MNPDNLCTVPQLVHTKFREAKSIQREQKQRELKQERGMNQEQEKLERKGNGAGKENNHELSFESINAIMHSVRRTRFTLQRNLR